MNSVTNIDYPAFIDKVAIALPEPDDDLTKFCLEHQDTIERKSAKGATKSTRTLAAFTYGGAQFGCNTSIRRPGFILEASPGKLTDFGRNVFPKGPAAELDLKACLDLMVDDLPDGYANAFRRRYTTDALHISRVDVTANAVYGSPQLATDAWLQLQSLEQNGRLPTVHKGTVRWKKASRLASLGVYRKGKDARLHNKTLRGQRYIPQHIAIADHLLRHEVTLGAEWFDKPNRGWDTTPLDLIQAHQQETQHMTRYHDMITESAEVKRRLAANNLHEKTIAQAYLYWVAIYQGGYNNARALLPRSSFRRWVKVLREAGIDNLERHKGNLKLVTEPMRGPTYVGSWEEAAKEIQRLNE